MPPLSMRQIPLAVLLLSCAAAVSAQSIPVAAVHASATWRYDVPAQPLNASLIAIASQAGARISIAADLARGVLAAPVQGEFTAEQAMRRALQGTALVLLKTDSGVYTVQAADARQAASQPADAVMPEVVLATNYLGQVTEDTGSYTTGAISTANRLVLGPRDTPHAVSVVTRQHMDDYGMVQLSEVLQHTPGVYAQHIDSERTIYYARGFSLDNFSYDGLPWTRDASLNLGESLANMDLYDRVEVLKGANALMSGAGTPGATVNLIRKKPTRAARVGRPVGGFMGQLPRHARRGRPAQRQRQRAGARGGLVPGQAFVCRPLPAPLGAGLRHAGSGPDTRHLADRRF